jgi:2-amino-4-hydroxy-6-hydroxymethyldihydropteridine diphosphokinase
MESRSDSTLISVLFSLGSNLGRRLHNLRAAVAQLQAFACALQVSAVYETEPKYFTTQPRFLNIAIAAESALAPLALLHALKQIEQQMGRVATRRFGPRLIDLDILAYGSANIHQPPTLEIPHPRLAERAFVLRPLLDVAPQWVHPQLGKTVLQLWQALPVAEQAEVIYYTDFGSPAENGDMDINEEATPSLPDVGE